MTFDPAESADHMPERDVNEWDDPDVTYIHRIPASPEVLAERVMRNDRCPESEHAWVKVQFCAMCGLVHGLEEPV